MNQVAKIKRTWTPPVKVETKKFNIPNVVEGCLMHRFANDKAAQNYCEQILNDYSIHWVMLDGSIWIPAANTAFAKQIGWTL